MLQSPKSKNNPDGKTISQPEGGSHLAPLQNDIGKIVSEEPKNEPQEDLKEEIPMMIVKSDSPKQKDVIPPAPLEITTRNNLLNDTVLTKLENKIDGTTRVVNREDATNSVAVLTKDKVPVSLTEPIPDLIPKPIPTSIPMQNQSGTQSSGTGLKVSFDFKEPNAEADSDGPKAGWTYVGSSKACNSKHLSHTTGGNVDRSNGFGNGRNNGSVNGTGNGGNNGSNDPSSNSSDISSIYPGYGGGNGGSDDGGDDPSDDSSSSEDSSSDDSSDEEDDFYLSTSRLKNLDGSKNPIPSLPAGQKAARLFRLKLKTDLDGINASAIVAPDGIGTFSNRNVPLLQPPTPLLLNSGFNHGRHQDCLKVSV